MFKILLMLLFSLTPSDWMVEYTGLYETNGGPPGILPPSQGPNGEIYFNFPVEDGSNECYFSTQNCVNYMVTDRVTSALSGSLVMTYQVQADPGTVFKYQFNNDGNTCNTGPHMMLFIAKKNWKGDGGNNDGRWWSFPVRVVLQDTGGPVQMVVPLTGDKWIQVWGHQAGETKAYLQDFQAALSKPELIGVAFGGGCFAAHGVNVLGQARFTLYSIGTIQ